MIAMVLGQRRLHTIHLLHARHLLAAHEEERARVARELHDDVVQRLALLGHELDAFGKSAPGYSLAKGHGLSPIRRQVDAIAEDLRELAHGLHPAMIDQAGLGATLTQLADDLGRTHGLHVQVELPEVPGNVPAAYGKDAEFYAFTRSLEAYRRSLGQKTSLFLSPDHEFFRYLDPRPPGR